MTDPIADMLTRIRNANNAKHPTVTIPASNQKKAIAQILLDEGYISDVKFTEDGKQADIVVKVSEEKAADVTTAYVDGKKCLCVPIEPDDLLVLNGEQI